MNPLITILIPQFRTLELTKLCLRLLRKYTNRDLVEVIVIDNASNDESLSYLKRVSWITLIERPTVVGETPPESHARALDLGLQMVRTPFFMSMHTDTLVCSNVWAEFLLEQIRQSDKIAGVGSWKLETHSLLKRSGKAIEDFVKRYLFFACYGRKFGEIPKRFKDHHYLRSHCALYRTHLVREFTAGFDDGDTAGKRLHLQLVEQGWEMKFLPSEVLSKYLCHLNHATMILNPAIAGQKTGTASARRRLRRELDALDYQQILSDDSLDS